MSDHASSATYTPNVSLYFSENVLRWSDYILAAADGQNVDPDLIAAIMTVESAGKADAVSSAGAIGLMQVMPFWFSYAELPYAYDPEFNINRGAYIFRHYYDLAGGDIQTALAYYNAGPGGAARGLGWGYANKVIQHYNAARINP